MNPEVIKHLTEMAQPAKPTRAQINELVAGWERYLSDIPEARHYEEFKGIITARLFTGVVSLVAPFTDPIPRL